MILVMLDGLVHAKQRMATLSWFWLRFKRKTKFSYVIRCTIPKLALDFKYCLLSPSWCGSSWPPTIGSCNDNGKVHEDLRSSQKLDCQLMHHFEREVLGNLSIHEAKLLVGTLVTCFKLKNGGYILKLFSITKRSIFVILLRTWLHWKYSYTWDKGFS